MLFSILAPMLFSILALILSPPSLANQENVAVDFRCVTSPPTTSFVAKTEGESVKLTIVHHNGVEYMPIHKGIIVPSDIPLLQKKAEVMQKLGERVEMVFEKKNCKKYGPGLFSCGLGKVNTEKGTSAVSASLLTKTANEKLYDMEFAENIVSAGFKVDNYYYSIDNAFYFDDCSFGN